MIILRRLECALSKTKDKVTALYKKNQSTPEQVLCKTSGYQFYNTCDFTLAKLLNDAPGIVENMTFYVKRMIPIHGRMRKEWNGRRRK